jgi:hypothetical protein
VYLVIKMSILDAEPWRALPRAVAALLAPDLPDLGEELLSAIGEQVPEYAKPLRGRFGENIQRGVNEALRQFLDLIEEPDRGRAQSREVYLELGRGEMHEGRSLDALQQAYRVGARVAWRRLARTGEAAGLSSAVLCVLADSIFAYIDELAADSVEGYAEAQQAAAGERDRRRSVLLAMLLGPAVDAGEMRAAAADAGWRIPRSASMLACEPENLAGIAMRLPPDALTGIVDETGCALIPDGEGPGQRRLIEAACTGTVAGVGPAHGAGQAGASWRRALDVLAAIRAGALPACCCWANDHLATLALLAAREPLGDLARARLGPLAGLTPAGRERMAATLAAFLDERGSAPAMARVLGVHPQTVRYRVRQLRGLFGDALDDPDARFELHAAVRAIGIGALGIERDPPAASGASSAPLPSRSPARSESPPSS